MNDTNKPPHWRKSAKPAATQAAVSCRLGLFNERDGRRSSTITRSGGRLPLFPVSTQHSNFTSEFKGDGSVLRTTR